MTPGVTGLAQVRGRDKNSADYKVRYESFTYKKVICLFKFVNFNHDESCF
jgi:lipopolysaccharide/colanic/teichoic acid biosynthesis glycosyltransferase